MKKLDLYIFKKFIGTFFLAISLLVVIVIIFDLSENLDLFLKHNAPWQRVFFEYYVTSIPYYINLFIYLFTFIAVVFFTSKMAAHTEVVAILSSGVSFWRFLYPYMLAAVTLAIMSLYFGNFLIPKTNEIRQAFKNEYMESLVTFGGNNIHVQIGPDEYVYIDGYNLEKDLGYRYCWEKYDGNELKYKMLGDIIYHDSVVPNKWRIDNYGIHHLNGGEEWLEKGRRMDTVFNLLPTDFYQIKEDYIEMDFFELRDHIAKMKSKGAQGVTAYEVEMQQRWAAPGAILILTLIGAALSSRKIKGGMGMHLGIGIVIAFSYILFMQISKSFAISGGLSPFMAAWTPNFIFSALAIVLLRKAPK